MYFALKPPYCNKNLRGFSCQFSGVLELVFIGVNNSEGVQFRKAMSIVKIGQGDWTMPPDTILHATFFQG